jgi:hypothetical protein
VFFCKLARPVIVKVNINIFFIEFIDERGKLLINEVPSIEFSDNAPVFALY